MTHRIALAVLQIIGAATIVPYPFVVVANVMSIAAPGQTVRGAIPFLLLTIYPALWIGLYVVAWRLLATGSAGLALALSGVPALAGFCALALYLRSEQALEAHYSQEAEETRARVEPGNPLLWTIWCAGGPKVSFEEALRAIDAHPELVNVPVGPYGTPLRTAVRNVVTNLDGTLQNQQDRIRIVRSLVAHGAEFSPLEKTDLWRSWQLRRALFDGPVTTAAENPLVWRIIQRKEFKIGPAELTLINQPTKLHGSPLYAALLANDFELFPSLIAAGARLSPEEERNPAATKALREMSQLRYPVAAARRTATIGSGHPFRLISLPPNHSSP